MQHKHKNKKIEIESRLIEIVEGALATLDVGDQEFKNNSTWVEIRKHIILLLGKAVLLERIEMFSPETGVV